MPHRLRAEGLAAFGPVERVRPRLADDAGVRVSDLARDASGALWFRAEGGALTTGVYRERPGEPARLVLADEGGALLEPRRYGGEDGVLVVKRCSPAGAPASAREILFHGDDERTVAVPGQSVAVSGDARVALVVDVPSRAFTRVELSSLAAQPVPVASDTLLAGADPQQAPLLALDDDGQSALFMDTPAPRGEASLYRLSLAGGAIERVHGPVPAPSWVSGAFVPGGRGELVIGCVYGEEPSTTMTWRAPGRAAREVFRAAVASPASVPAWLDDDTAVLPLSLTTHPRASYGPVQLVAVSLSGKAPVVITKSGDVRGAVRVFGDTVVVEGDDALLTVTKA